MAKARFEDILLGLFVLVALGKFIVDDRPPVPQHATYTPAPSPRTPSPPTAPPIAGLTAAHSASPAATPKASTTAPVQSNLTRTLTPRPRKVMAQSLSMRRGPGTGYSQYGVPLNGGTVVIHTGDAQEVNGETWIEVSYQGRLGWVNGRFLGPANAAWPLPAPEGSTTAAAASPSTSPAATPEGSPTAAVQSNLTRTLTPVPQKVLAQSLNMRRGPGTSYSRYGEPLPGGTVVIHTGDAREVGGETWMEISYQGRLGWVNGRFLGPMDTTGPQPAPAASTTAPAAHPATLLEAPQVEAPAIQSRKAGSGFTCGGKSTCGQMNSCAEANFYLNQCGIYRLDRDRDGYPCESGPC